MKIEDEYRYVIFDRSNYHGMIAPVQRDIVLNWIKDHIKNENYSIFCHGSNGNYDLVYIALKDPNDVMRILLTFPDNFISIKEFFNLYM